MTQREELVIDVFGELTGALLRDGPRDTVYQMVASLARTLADADLVTVAVRRDDGMLSVPAIAGAETDLSNAFFPAENTLNARVMESGQPLVIADVSKDTSVNAGLMGTLLGPAVYLPLAIGEPYGSLNVFRVAGREPFGEGECRLLTTLATQAGLAMGYANVRERAAEQERLRERAQIAQDLQGVASDRIFAASLSLSGLVSEVADRSARARIIQVIEDLDEAIRLIRNVALGVEKPPLRHGP